MRRPFASDRTGTGGDSTAGAVCFRTAARALEPASLEDHTHGHGEHHDAEDSESREERFHSASSHFAGSRSGLRPEPPNSVRPRLPPRASHSGSAGSTRACPSRTSRDPKAVVGIPRSPPSGSSFNLAIGMMDTSTGDFAEIFGVPAASVFWLARFTPTVPSLHP